ncbi:MAG TPA: phytanoyl-CoA dioxygenase family protein [Devosia sp.]|jgi:ectoine hydroxylase-related dioxygenase (phytanoyl-CoA dioxygenase family)|uniref:phytanoyl-CoA dioxygenase family protein n=1 Tax=Devosia sp. TaxID=1871048 RepID=UPI002DDD1D76|nr:phytanoyl-CoA dioxygenase family protein [Devosia sp.]HEV2517365.1 phytanoyl-CoA dioxygenase family protein [Devosia sp.]
MPDFDLQDFLFDLRGYLILEKAIDATLLANLNRAFDNFPELQFGEWWGNAQRLDNNGHAGLELQNIVEAGKPFEALIDHPSWIDRLRRYCGEDGTYVGGLFIDECFASVRRNGGYFPLHSGGQDGVVRNQFRFVNGQFRCGQVNILLALTDIGPGDGGTRILPGSHKSNIAHPVFARNFSERVKDEDEVVEGSIEVNMKAGDALMFVDALSHGATKRINPGDRRVVIFRYGPSWGNTRYGFKYSQELLDRVTPEQRKILEPITPRHPGTQRGLERLVTA